MRVDAMLGLVLAACGLTCCAGAAGGDQVQNLASAESGAVFFAEPTSPTNGSLAYINDGYESSYWYAGDGQPRSGVLVVLRQPSMVHAVRFLSWATGRHAPRDYQVLAIDSRTGESHLIADVKGDTTLAPKWVDLKAQTPVLADQILLRVADTQEHEHGALLYELQVLGLPAKDGTQTDAPKLDPRKTYLLVSAGKSLSSPSSEPVSLTLSAGLPGSETPLLTKSFRDPWFSRLAIDLSKWEGKTINLTFEASGASAKDAGVWLDPRLVKGKESIADLIGYWSAHHDGVVEGAAIGDGKSSRAIVCPVTDGGASKMTIRIPVSARLLREMEKNRVETEHRKYGASDDRLQARQDSSQQADLTGKWEMAGQDADLAHPIGTGKPRELPDMVHWTWHEVSVPGSIRSGLLEAGVIEDPNWSDNAPKSIWVEKKDWWFRKSVVVPESWSGRRIMLGFDGIDYYSSVWINGKFLGDHEGMYGGPVEDVTSLVRFGRPNEVVVKVHTGGTDEPGRVFKGFIFMKWHYQTDMSPRGIWRGTRMVATGPVRIENPFVKTVSADEKEAVLEITADAQILDGAKQVTISGVIVGEGFRSRQQTFALPVTSRSGKQTIQYRLRVPNPRLWWPNGMGAPNLYRLVLRASVQGKASDSVSTTFGIRTLVFGQNPGVESKANSRFMCRVNGRLISMRGAGGFGAHDQIYRFHDRKDAWFIKAAQSLNFNFIRVHGAGIIATDEFYNLCDRMGMMVWQEFMISNMGISGEHPDVWRAQTVQSILRLRNHPSLIRWCGGNEFNPDATGDDTKAIVDMFEQSVAKYDGTRLFNRSAQYVNDPHYADETGFYGGTNLAACTEYSGVYAANILGSRSLAKFLPAEDVHRWPPVTKEKLERLIPQDLHAAWDNSRRGPFVFHTALTGRCEGWGWPGDLTVILPQWVFFGVPRTMDEAFRISQVSGGYTTSYTAETFRSHWPHPSLYASWDFAPIWPMSIIWGPVDYYGAVLPCAYYYKRAQEPLHVMMQLDSKDYVKTPVLPLNAFTKIYEPGDQFKGRVYVASDLDHALSEHMAEVQVFDSKLDQVYEGSMVMKGIGKGPSSAFLGNFLWSIPASMPNQVALVCVTLRDAAGKQVSRSCYPIWISSEFSKLIKDPEARIEHAPRLTELAAAQTKLRIRPVSKSVRFSQKDYLPGGDQHCGRAVLEITNVGAKPSFHTGVEITNADCRYTCDDNYVLLMPGESKRITIDIDRTTQPFFEYVKPELVEPVGRELRFTASAWNAPEVVVAVPVAE